MQRKHQVKRARRGSSRGRRRPQSGYSLLEVTFAAALMFVIAAAVVPLFLRSLESNAKGGFSSIMANFVTGDLEAANQISIDNPDWNIPPVGVLDLGSEYWRTDPDGGIGSGAWHDSPDGPGQAVWVRRREIRKYSFADISEGTISTSGGTIHTTGNPLLFDTPLIDDNDGDGFKAHFVEMRVSVQPCRLCGDEDNPDEYVSLGQRMSVSHYRTF